MVYHTSSYDYLERAQERFAEGSHQALFYAALELCCGIEQRIQEYLNTQKQISNKLQKGWRITHLGKNLNKVFKERNKVIEFTIIDETKGDPIIILYYTPVTTGLQNVGKKLGNYLHAMREYQPDESEWWQDFKWLLKRGIKGLEGATKGNLMGIPLLNPSTNELAMHTKFERNDSLFEKLGAVLKETQQMNFRVRYLDPEVF
jgi:hypothetical protein